MREVKPTTRQLTPPSADWQAAAEFGCDMELLEAHLAMTPAQRVRTHRSALALAEKLRGGMEQAVERSGNTDQTTSRPAR